MNELNLIEVKESQEKKVYFFRDGINIIATSGSKMIKYPVIDESVDLVINELLKKF